jgi:hypothetical protein
MALFLSVRLAAGGDARGQTRFVAAGSVAMNNPLARHLVDERDGLLQRGFGGADVVLVDRRADALEHSAQARPELSIAFAIFQALTVRFQRGFMTGQDVLYLRNH